MLRTRYPYNFSMRDDAVYAEVETLRERAKAPALSPIALEIHVRAVDHTVHTTCPAFISDEALDAIAPARVTTMAALELCLAEVWHRAKDGYVIADFDLIDHMSESPTRRRLLAFCRRLWRELNSEKFIPL
ncbi:MAG: hypothetical protein JWR34_4563 [Mycobacterium sp.]|nr:hypothetical protein [Mycobacterium sp.]